MLLCLPTILVTGACSPSKRSCNRLPPVFACSLTLPHSISVQLAYPNASLANGNGEILLSASCPGLLHMLLPAHLVSAVPPPVCINTCRCLSAVYGALPKTAARSASIVLMLSHQVAAFCLYSAPLNYM